MKWLNTVSEGLNKAVKYAAFVYVIVETLQFLAEKVNTLNPQKSEK